MKVVLASMVDRILTIDPTRHIVYHPLEGNSSEYLLLIVVFKL